MKKYFNSVLKTTQELGQKGFTLMEMLIVIALIGMVGSFVAVKVIRSYDQAKVDSTKIQIKQLSTILEDFRRICSFYPTTEMGLDALVHKPEGRECKNYDPEGFVKRVPKDSWDHDFIYISDGNKFTIKSLGADGQEGGDGFNKDISSDDLD